MSALIEGKYALVCCFTPCDLGKDVAIMILAKFLRVLFCTKMSVGFATNSCLLVDDRCSVDVEFLFLN
jgi:hypothetical protein